MEQRRCEREQVKALRLIFKLVQRDVELLREFVHCGGYAMIEKVCMSNRCIIGHELIKVESFAGFAVVKFSLEISSVLIPSIVLLLTVSVMSFFCYISGNVRHISLFFTQFIRIDLYMNML